MSKLKYKSRIIRMTLDICRCYLLVSFWLVFFLSGSSISFADNLADKLKEPIKLLQTNIQVNGEYEFLTIYFSGKTKYKYFLLDKPNRLVIDMPKLKREADISLNKNYGGQLVKSIRFALFNKKTSRLVFDLKQKIKIIKIDKILKNSDKPFRLRFEITKYSSKHNSLRNKTGKRNIIGITKHKAGFIPKPKPKPKSLLNELLKPAIIIDPGHGGRDPGTISKSGIKEKNITMIFSKELYKKLRATGRYKVALTRSKDEFILLRDRITKNRKIQGDVFISIHADSAPSQDARGASVYTLSEKASDAEAAALAAQENKVDLLYDVNIPQQYEEIADILIDLTQRDSKHKSEKLAKSVIKGMKRNKIRLLDNTHRFAGFAVLKSHDMASILVEIGFLSNRYDEKRLRSTKYRRQLINGIISGIDRYFKKSNIRY